MMVIVREFNRDPPVKDLALLAKTVKEWTFGDQLRFWILIVPLFFVTLKAATIPVAANKGKRENH